MTTDAERLAETRRDAMYRWLNSLNINQMSRGMGLFSDYIDAMFDRVKAAEERFEQALRQATIAAEDANKAEARIQEQSTLLEKQQAVIQAAYDYIDQHRHGKAKDVLFRALSATDGDQPSH